MTVITARWEWRAFGEDFGQAEAAIRATGEPFVRESAEVYVVSRRSGDNTKIRNQLMDIKRLRQVDAHGLEQWYPVTKSGFPLPREEVERVFAAWGLEPPELEQCDHTTLIDELVAAHPDLRAVPVTKLRHGFLIDEAMVELADLTIDGSPIRTVCVEHADPERVWRVVGELGLQHRENVNYLRAIKRAVGWEAT